MKYCVGVSLTARVVKQYNDVTRASVVFKCLGQNITVLILPYMGLFLPLYIFMNCSKFK